MAHRFELDAAEVCRQYGSSVLRRCRAILGDVHDAEDAAQEVFLTVMTKGTQFRNDASVSTWLYRVTTNICLNRMRGNRRRAVREESDAVAAWAEGATFDPYQHYVGRGMLTGVVRELDRLSQAVFVHRYIDGMSLDEIASATGKSRKTIGKRIKTIEAFVDKRGGGE